MRFSTKTGKHLQYKVCFLDNHGRQNIGEFWKKNQLASTVVATCIPVWMSMFHTKITMVQQHHHRNFLTPILVSWNYSVKQCVQSQDRNIVGWISTVCLWSLICYVCSTTICLPQTCLVRYIPIFLYIVIRFGHIFVVPPLLLKSPVGSPSGKMGLIISWISRRASTGYAGPF